MKRLRSVSIIAVAILVGFLVNGAVAATTNVSQFLGGGQNDTVRCSTQGETWNKPGTFPLVARCPRGGSTTTTTTPVTSTSTTEPPVTTTTAPGRHHHPTTTTTAPVVTTTGGHGTTTTVAHGPTTTVPSSGVFRLFGASSLWNTVKDPTDFVTSATSTIQGIAFGLNNGAYDHPFYNATSSDPMTTFHLGSGWGHTAETITANAPAGMQPAAGGDEDMDVLLTNGTLLDMYGVTGSGTNWTAEYYGTSDGINGPGFGGPPTYPDYYAIGTTAIGSPQAAGTILASDVAAGVIDHGLTMACGYGYEGNSPSGLGDELYYPDGPAVSNDDGGGGGPLSEGSLLMIPPGTAMAPGLDAMGKQLWAAAATRGVYITDQAGGGCYFYGDGSSTVSNAFSSNDFQIVGQALQLVNTWSSSTQKTVSKETPKEAPVIAPKEYIQPAPCPSQPKSVFGCSALKGK